MLFNTYLKVSLTIKIFHLKFTIDSYLVQPMTSTFSTRALIWFHFKTLHEFSQPIFSLILPLKNELYNLAIELCLTQKIFQKCCTILW